MASPAIPPRLSALEAGQIETAPTGGQITGQNRHPLSGRQVFENQSGKDKIHWLNGGRTEQCRRLRAVLRNLLPQLLRKHLRLRDVWQRHVVLIVVELNRKPPNAGPSRIHDGPGVSYSNRLPMLVTASVVNPICS